MYVITVLLLVFFLIQVQGVYPPGLISLRKCNELHHLNIDEENFAPLTEEQLKKVKESELNYNPTLPFAGGVKAIPKQLPFMAALGFQDGNQKRFLCGGTLISDQFVLTAAHCISSRFWGTVKYIRLGDLNLTSTTDDYGAQEYSVKEYFVHPNYSYPKKYHDIALIKLDKPVVFSDYVYPACLEPVRTNLNFQEELYAAGWGLIGHGEEPSDHLQVGTLRNYPIKLCEDLFQRDYSLPEGIIDDYQICAGAIKHLADTCEGDSGGPLAYRYLTQIPEQKVYYVSGITSFGKVCALAFIPSIYTRVSYYTEWIEKIVWPSSNSWQFDPNKIYFPDDFNRLFN